jgi:predicted ATPase
MTIHLRAISLGSRGPDEVSGFPFDVPAIAAFDRLTFDAPVTCFVGENGSGKSTLLEAIAWAAESVAAGSEPLERDATLAAVRPLGRALRLTWSRRTRRGLFLRAEDFFGWVKDTARRTQELAADLTRLEAESAHLHEGERRRITAPYRGSVEALRSRYGDDPDAGSHGEQFLAFFKGRFVPGGLYLLDEPEAALSPQSQLAFLALVKSLAEEQRAQFVIATHSPILMALPGAELLSFDASPPRPVAWEDVEQVALMRDFLRHPDAFLRHL